MQRTKIVVGYQHTRNLGNYSNARPSITIEAVLDEGDDPEVVKAALHSEAVAYVHEAIDQALELDGQPATFSGEPRFRLERTADVAFGAWNERRRVVSPPEKLLVILPVGIKLRDNSGDNKSWWTSQGGNWHKMRFAAIHNVADAWMVDEPGYRLIDCSDGDLSRLPAWSLEAPIDPGPPAPTPVADPSDLGGYVVLDEGDEDEEDYDTAIESSLRSTPGSTLSLLLLAGEDPPALEVIEGWTPEQLAEVSRYAAAVHVKASDNDDVEIPPRPAVLSPGYAAERAASQGE